MFSTDEKENSIAFTLSSALRHVDTTLQACQGFLQARGMPDSADFGIVLRELLSNAIEHGNGGAVDRLVRCLVERVGERRLRVVVEDEGAGFDFQRLNLRLPDDPRHERRRGLALVNAFADELRFEQGGRQVTAYMTLAAETAFAVTEAEGVTVVQPSGDLTAGNAEALRQILVGGLDRGVRAVRFDLRAVKLIDSIALSVLICFARMLESNGGAQPPEMINVDHGLTSLFRVTHLDRMFRVVEV